MTTDETKAYVLDSFALLAYLEDEPGADRVQEILREAEREKARVFLCVISLGEVFYITCREQGRIKADEVLAVLDLLPIQDVEVDRKLVLAAASIKATHTVSYADSFVAALAQQIRGEVVTGDPEFKQLEGTVGLCWLPQR